MNNPIDKVFDTTSLQEYYEYLQEDLINSFNDYIEEHNELCTETEEDKKETVHDISEVDFGVGGFFSRFEEDIFHYQNIKAFVEELQYSNNSYKYGETVIREDYWEEYCEELLTEIGYISSDFPSWIVIDWKATSQNISEDYSTIEFEGNTYYIRCL